MANTLHITVENPDELLNAGQYDAGAVIRVQTSATETGVYADVTGTGSTPTVPIVAGTLLYDAFDPSGTTTSWYRVRYENAGGTRTSDWSPVFQVAGLDAYASLAQFRTFIRSAAVGDDGDDPDSTLMVLALEAAARAIDLACNRTFRLAGSTVTARYFTPLPRRMDPSTWKRNVTLDIDDVFDTTGMTVTFDATGNGDYTTAITTYRVGPSNASARRMPYTLLIFDSSTYPPTTIEGVKVEALWGWDKVPSTITSANLIQAARFLKRRDAPFGVAGSPDMGNELRLLAKLDPDVAVMVSPFKRWWA